MRQIPINVDESGCAKAVLAGYYKFYAATLIADSYGTSGTCVLEINEKDKAYKHDF